VTGGSQGAAVFGEVVPAAVALLPEGLRRRLRIAQQARPENIEQARAAYAGTGVEVELQTFFRDMPDRLAGCHLAICRSGASTVAELTTAGRPALLVPYPHAIDDHQTANAASLADAGGAWLMPQPGFTAASLAERLAQLLAQPADLAAAAAASRAWGIPDAADRLADAVLDLIHGANGSTPLQGVAA
jgi:UDP-N-acetylglucosamine--N-acetylmuramyl-(pentapeptide) pyrophosphoryl-undecaprenol N-acetylglucosamine transferase